MTLALLAALATLTAPPVGDPAPARELPRDLESAPWEALYVEQCKERLTVAGQTSGYYFSSRNRLDERKRRGYPTIYCHIPQASVWTRGSSDVRYYGFTIFNCAMSLAMTRFEQVAQEVAREVFETDHEAPMTAVRHMGTYNCRRLRHNAERQSQHSFGNAIDFAAFWVRGYGVIDVLKDWTPRWPSRQKASDFLQKLVQRLQDEHVFTNVLGPDYDDAHKNHIHVDLAALSDGLPSPALARTKCLPAVEGESVDPADCLPEVPFEMLDMCGLPEHGEESGGASEASTEARQTPGASTARTAAPE